MRQFPMAMLLIFVTTFAHLASALIGNDEDTTKKIKETLTEAGGKTFHAGIFAQADDVIFQLTMSIAIVQISTQNLVSGVKENIKIVVLKTVGDFPLPTNHHNGPTVFVFPTSDSDGRGGAINRIENSATMPNWTKMNLARVAVVCLEYKATDDLSNPAPIFLSIVTFFPVPSNLITRPLIGCIADDSIVLHSERRAVQFAISSTEKTAQDSEYCATIAMEEMSKNPEDILGLKDKLDTILKDASGKDIFAAATFIQKRAWDESLGMILLPDKFYCLVSWRYVEKGSSKRSFSPDPRRRLTETVLRSRDSANHERRKPPTKISTPLQGSTYSPAAKTNLATMAQAPPNIALRTATPPTITPPFST